MLTLAVVGTFYGRHENTLPLAKRLYVDSTRPPDEAWLIGETPDDVKCLHDAFDTLYELELLDELRPAGLRIAYLPTPAEGGRYRVIPYSHKINWALDQSDADLFVYLDNNSWPDPEKYRVMAEALEGHPGWGAVYCGQRRTGVRDETVEADRAIADAYCALNFTQVMHRRTDDRWPLDLELADPDLADATFWRDLHKTLGPFYPVGERVLDDHDIPDVKAVGIN